MHLVISQPRVSSPSCSTCLDHQVEVVLIRRDRAVGVTVSGQRSFHPVTSFNLGRSATTGVVAHGLRASPRRARSRVSCAAMLQLTALLLVAQIQVPPPRGYVNDFAAALDSAPVAHMEAVIAEVRAKTRGEIAVVTLADID